MMSSLPFTEDWNYLEKTRMGFSKSSLVILNNFLQLE